MDDKSSLILNYVNVNQTYTVVIFRNNYKLYYTNKKNCCKN